MIGVRMRPSLRVVKPKLVLAAAFSFMVVVAIAGIAAGTSTEPAGNTAALACEVNQQHEGFRVTQIRAGGNSAEAYRTLSSCFAESDFRLTPDLGIIAAHDDQLSGNCGLVSEGTPESRATCRLANGHRVASLEDFLRSPLSEWFIDLKTSFDSGDATINQAVRVAASSIEFEHRKQGAVVMLYRAPDEAVEILRAAGIRAGMKGYPESLDDTRRLIDEAAKHGFELVCVNVGYIDADVIEYAEARGVWVLGWETGEKPPEYWVTLAEAGLGGLITDRISTAENKLLPADDPARLN